MGRGGVFQVSQVPLVSKASQLRRLLAPYFCHRCRLELWSRGFGCVHGDVPLHSTPRPGGNRFSSLSFRREEFVDSQQSVDYESGVTLEDSQD